MTIKKTTPEEAIKRVVDKRLRRGATIENVRAWLEHCRDEVWRSGPTHAAIKKMLQDLPEHSAERAAEDALLGQALDGYRKDFDVWRTATDELRREYVKKIRVILEGK